MCETKDAGKSYSTQTAGTIGPDMGYFWHARLSYEHSLQFSFIYIVTNHNGSLYLGKVKTLE